MNQEVPKGVCKHFWNTGRCTFPNCKFKHETNPSKPSNTNHQNKTTGNQNVNNINKNTSNSSTIEKHSIPRFYSLLDKPFRHQHDMRKFVLSALKESDTGDVVLALGEKKEAKGLNKLREILQCEFETRAGNSAAKYSFQRIIVPLCHLLTLPQFSNSTLVTQLRVIYGAVFGEVRFFPKVIACCEELMKYGRFNPERVEEEETVWTPQDWKDVIRPIVKLFFIVLTRVTDAAADDAMPDIVERLHNLAVREPDAEILADIKKAQTTIDSVRIKEDYEAMAKMQSQEILDQRLAFSIQMDAEIPDDIRNQPGPGEIHPLGPRHNNDFADYRRIKILPTEDEILCEEDPYVPIPDGSEHVASPVDRYLDVHFRQLREDMLASVRRGVQGFLNQNALAQMNKTEVKFSVKPSVGKDRSDRSDSVALHVYRNISISDPLPTLHRGVCFRVQFDQLPNLAKMTRNQRLDFWKLHAGSRQLEVSSLICIALGVTAPAEGKAKADKLIFATIADKKEIDLLDDRCTISIQLLESSVTADLATYISHLTQPSDNINRKENVMIQVRGHFFPGYEPVLNALQAHNVETLPFIDFIVEDPDLNNMRPQFLKDDTVFDLSVIQSTSNGKLACPVGDYDRLRKTLRQHADNLKLDNTQIDAFAAALTRKVSLIQGPPGTGKTYIGIQIVRALLANSSGNRVTGWQTQGRIAPAKEAPVPPLYPILCICYTNHALDQFLEGLVHAGIPVENIVRAGGRSQSEVLLKRNLHDLAYGEKTPQEKHAFWIIKQEAERLEKEIDFGIRALHSKNYDYFLRWMKYAFPRQYSSITMESETEEGFQQSVKPDRMLYTWLTQESPYVENQQTEEKPIESQNQYSILKKEDASKSQPSNTNSKNNNVIPIAQTQSRESRSFAQLEQVNDCWTMSLPERKIFFDTIMKDFREEVTVQLERDIRGYNDLVKRNKEINDSAQLRVLKGAQIVGFTTSGCAKYQTLLKALSPRVVICEEAGEVLESHVLASLTSGTEQLILIGDHLQLRPKVTEYSLSKDSGNGFDLDISLFERLVNKYQRKYRGGDLHQLGLLCTLDTQRRMRPQIADILRGTLYPTLQDSEAVKIYPPLKGFGNDLWFFDHEWQENTDVGEQSVSVKSYFNQKEAEMVVELVRYAIRQGYQKEQIAVLTPYVGQLILLRKLLSQKKMLLQLEEQDLLLLEAAGVDDTELEETNDSTENDNNAKIPSVQRVSLKERVRLSTVDNFQGEEAELVIISTVRSNPKGRTGFLKIDNRVNVMLSRAKHGMVILGSSRTIKRSRNAVMFHKILDILEKKKAIGNFIDLKCQNHKTITRVNSSADVEALDGGCDLPCNYRMSCGHQCKKLCHPDQAQHQQIECREPCEKTIPLCGHPCQNLCFQKCGGCNVVQKVRLACGHTVEIPCSQATQNAQCPELVTVKMPLCGHVTEIQCWKSRLLEQQQSLLKQKFDEKQINRNSVLFACTHKCGELIEGCFHACQRSCGECSLATVLQTKEWTPKRTQHGKCTTACKRPLFCGHECGDGTCHPQSNCPPCKQNCFIKCEHSSCGKKCKEPCDACVENCTWVCTCGKGLSCPMACGSPCTRLPCDTRCTKTLECGHQCPSLCGEPCPDKNYCPQCAPDNVKNQQVDFINLTTLGEHNPDESPLLVLPCKHVFTVETLDGIVGIDKVYKKDNNGKWNGLIPLDSIPEEDGGVLQCPTCRSPISGIRRYGRMLNWVLVRRIRQKHYLYIQEKSANYQQQIKELNKKIEELSSKNTKLSHETAKLQKSINFLIKTISTDSSDCEHNAPTLKLYNLDRARAQKANLQPELVKLIAPNTQSLLPLLHALLKAFSTRLQFLFYLWQDNITQGKGKPNTNNQKPTQTQLEAVQKTYEQCIDVSEKLFRFCEKAKAKSYQQKAMEEAALVHMQYINGLANIQLPEDTKPEPTIRERQMASLERLKRILQNLPHSSLHDMADEIEKKLKQATFYQGVTAQELKAVAQAMERDIGSGVGSYGGHWYQCPNGHIYAIGECGGAMQTSTCNECGAVIGGSDHRLNNNNTVATQFLQTVNQQAPPSNWNQNLARDEALARRLQQ